MNPENTPSPSVSPLLTLQELAQAVKLPKAWLRAQSDAGALPCLRVGHKTLYCAEAVRAALVSQAQNPSAKKGRPRLADRPKAAALAQEALQVAL